MAQSALTEGALWEEFHRLVNMSSRELAGWLDTRSEAPEAESLQADTPTGQQVLRVWNKRRTDLTSEDLGVMRNVVQRVSTERRRGHREPTAGPAGWRHRLMSLGHDPLKPA